MRWSQMTSKTAEGKMEHKNVIKFDFVRLLARESNNFFFFRYFDSYGVGNSGIGKI